MTKGIFITSLNSRRLQDAINNKHNPCFSNDIDELDIFVFDTFEILNGIFFSDENAGTQKQKIESIIQCLETDFLSVDSSKRKLIRCSKKRKEINPYILAVYTEFYTNPIFESHCKNQVFQNLQPKLNRLSVANNRSNLIDLLIPFLLVEIALYLFIYHKDEYCKILGMENEMNIISAIKTHKYSSFSNFLSSDIDYIKIPVPQNA